MYRRTSPQAGSRLVKKCLTVDMFIGMLSQRAHHQVEVGNIRANLYDIFKDDASIMVKSFARNIISKLQVFVHPFLPVFLMWLLKVSLKFPLLSWWRMCL